MSKFSISKRRVAWTVASALAAGALLGVSIFIWYLGLPDTLIHRRIEREFCIQCGNQALLRRYAFFEHVRIATTARTVRKASRKYQAHDCDETYVTIAVKDVSVELGAWQLDRWSYGKIDGEPFWSNPLLVDAFARLYATNHEHAISLFGHLIGLVNNGKVPPDLQSALNTDSSELIVAALYENYAGTGRKLPGARR